MDWIFVVRRPLTRWVFIHSYSSIKYATFCTNYPMKMYTIRNHVTLPCRFEFMIQTIMSFLLGHSVTGLALGQWSHSPRGQRVEMTCISLWWSLDWALKNKKNKHVAKSSMIYRKSNREKISNKTLMINIIIQSCTLDRKETAKKNQKDAILILFQLWARDENPDPEIWRYLLYETCQCQPI